MTNLLSVGKLLHGLPTLTDYLYFGIWLAFGVGASMIGTALLLSIFRIGRKVKRDRL
ncbi:MAG: hypothetical protein WBB01_10105 [Phormidesmis sp.]